MINLLLRELVQVLNAVTLRESLCVDKGESKCKFGIGRLLYIHIRFGDLVVLGV